MRAKKPAGGAGCGAGVAGAGAGFDGGAPPTVTTGMGGAAVVATGSKRNDAWIAARVAGPSMPSATSERERWKERTSVGP